MRPKGPSESDAEKWDVMYRELEAYYKKHGHSNVPSTLKTKLSYWVSRQRLDRRSKEARMTTERIARLDKLKFAWGTRRATGDRNWQKNEKLWQEMYEKLKAFEEKHGHCKVPIQANAEDSELGPLGAWVARQRARRNTMKQNQKDLLDQLGFLWYADNWDTTYEQLVEFKREHGHTNVSTRYPTLGAWCNKQRIYMRQNKLSRERRTWLEDIGFDYELQSEKNERMWNEKFQRLKKYKREHGDCLVPTKNAVHVVFEDEELSVWVSHQRGKYKRGMMLQHRIDKLNNIGFVWSLQERGSISITEKYELQWEKSYEELREFHETHGHFIVPHLLDGGKINPLSSWISMQRRLYSQGELKKDRKQKLDAIDFVWIESVAHECQRLWDTAFQELCKFREEKGHTFVKRSDDLTLWRWTEKMNWKRKRGTLSQERHQRLESIGFWDSPPPGYQERGENSDESEDSDKAEDDEGEELIENEEEEGDDCRPLAKRRRIASIPTKHDIDTGSLTKYSIGTKVKKFFEGYGWFLGEIVSIGEDRYKIQYEDGDEEEYLPEELGELDEIVANVHTTRHPVGTNVKKYFEGHGWFLGKIVSIHEDRCKIRYEDGDEEEYLFETEMEELDNIVAKATKK